MAAATPVTPRPASTLVLMRDPPQGGPPELLVMERSASADFAAGAYVFPGGGLEAPDQSPEAVRLSPGLVPALAGQTLGSATSDAEALGYYVAAIRETFEESGILLGRPGPGQAASTAAAVAQARAQMNQGALSFLDWMAREGWVLSTEQLVYFAHWVTPEAVPKRFDTRFFLAAAPQGMEAAHDAQEVVSHRWITAEAALEAWRQKRIHMIEPTVKNLEKLAEFPSTQAALQGLRGKPVTRIMPKLVVNAQGKRVIVFPWDPAYETA
ncbi:MAG TPA: hypothetical protein VF678_14880 [bacterium]